MWDMVPITAPVCPAAFHLSSAYLSAPPGCLAHMGVWQGYADEWWTLNQQSRFGDAPTLELSVPEALRPNQKASLRGTMAEERAQPAYSLGDLGQCP